MKINTLHSWQQINQIPYDLKQIINSTPEMLKWGTIIPGTLYKHYNFNTNKCTFAFGTECNPKYHPTYKYTVWYENLENNQWTQNIMTDMSSVARALGELFSTGTITM